jgi:hypothetical protein
VDAYVESVRAYQALTPDARIDALYAAAASEHGGVVVSRAFGTNLEGGDFDTVHVAMSLVRGGRVARTENYDIDQLDAALARFEQLTRGASQLAGDPLVIASNAATRAADRQWELARARDWEALRALCSPALVFDDRKRLARTRGGVEMLLASLRTFRWERLALERTPIATAGDRVALEHRRWRGQAGDAGEFESESITLTEVDAGGRIVAMVMFDAEDRAAAFDEARTRFLAGEAEPVGGQHAAATMNRAIARMDWTALRDSLTEDFEMRDLRTLGHGRLGRDAHVESMRALASLGSGVRVEQLQLLAWNRHGSVAVVRTAGVNDAGGDFEMLAIGVTIASGDRVALLERYDLADTERALARFEALCAEHERTGK